MSLPNTTYVDKYINDGNRQTLSLRNFYDTMLVGNTINSEHIIRIPTGDFFIKYRKELSEITLDYALSQEMFYKPKSLSLELYGTTELWLSLLRLNDMKNITEFHLPIIKIYHAKSLKDLISIYFKRAGVIS